MYAGRGQLQQSFTGKSCRNCNNALQSLGFSMQKVFRQIAAPPVVHIEKPTWQTEQKKTKRPANVNQLQFASATLGGVHVHYASNCHEIFAFLKRGYPQDGFLWSSSYFGPHFSFQEESFPQKTFLQTVARSCFKVLGIAGPSGYFFPNQQSASLLGLLAKIKVQYLFLSA